MLDNQLMEGRFSAFHAIMSAATLGILPPGYPPGGRHQQCVAALTFLNLLLGWLVPTYVVLQTYCQAAAARQRRQITSSSGSGVPAGASGSGSLSSSSPRSAQGGKLVEALDPVAMWALDKLWIAGGLGVHKVQAWCALAIMCWLFATVLTILTVSPALAMVPHV